MSEAAHHHKIKHAAAILAAALSALSVASAQRLEGGAGADRLQPSGEPVVKVVEIPSLDALEQLDAANMRTVHLASYYSEADALRGWNVLVARHGALLDRHDPILREVDLGERGIYVRLLAGPLSGPDEAAQLCDGLMGEGAYCVPASAAGEFLLEADGF